MNAFEGQALFESRGFTERDSRFQGNNGSPACSETVNAPTNLIDVNRLRRLPRLTTWSTTQNIPLAESEMPNIATCLRSDDQNETVSKSVFTSK